MVTRALSLLFVFSSGFAFAGQDLKLSYRSQLDGTVQPYRVYLPAAYDGSKPFPLVIALHGTGGNENTLLDDPRYQNSPIKAAADKYGVILLSPVGRGITDTGGTP